MKDREFRRRFLSATRRNVVDVDFTTQQIRCSALLIQSFRLTPETLPLTLEQWFELYHPDDYPKIRQIQHSLYESSDVDFSAERRIYCGDGQYRRFRLDAFCIRSRNGQIRRMIGVETDLSMQQDTEQRMAELQTIVRDLRENLSTLQARAKDLSVQLSHKEAQCETLETQLHRAKQTLNATPDLLFLRDTNGRILLRNEAFAAATSSDPAFAALAETASDEKNFSRKDSHGRLRSLIAHVYPFFDCYGRMTGEIGAFSDITEIGEMESDMMRLRRSMREKALRTEVSLPKSADEKMAAGYRKVFDTPDLEKDLNGENCDLLDSKEFLGGYLNGALRALLNTAATGAVASTDGAGLLPARVSQLETLLHAAGGTELEVGVVGITSSGKSTFINAMMGERLLPEETRATTNLVVRCRRGDERAVTVVARNGECRRVSGTELTAAWMESLASERLNPGNEQAVACLEWTSPGAALPEGLVLIDTPGLDACGFPEHSELVMRQILPSLDIVLYITSIRNRFKAADLDLLAATLEHDQRVIFLLSQIDLEQDDTEGGKVVLSRRRKLTSCVRELREDIGQGVLAGAAVIPISSKLAMAHFYDRDSAAWTASNFGPLIRQMEIFQADLSRYRVEARGRRALMLLSRTTSDLGLALGALSTERTETEGAARLEKIRELRDAQRWISAEVSAVRNEWRRLLSPDYHLKRLREEIQGLTTVRGIKDRYEQWSEECTDLAPQMTARMDRARRSCHDILGKHGIVPRECPREVSDIKNELPAFYRYVLHEARNVRVRGWFENLQFWPRYQTFFRQDVDRKKILESVGDQLTERLRLLNDHLTWWENRMREDCCDPLYEELAREEAALADIRRIATDTSVSRAALRQAMKGVSEAERGVKNLLSGLSLPDIDPEALFSDDLFDRFEEISKTPENPPEHETLGIFTSLLATYHEQNIQSRFLEIEAVRKQRRIVLLGLRRHDAVRFLSRLAHDASLGDRLYSEYGGEIDERQWIFCGSIPPAFPHLRIAVPDSLLRELEVLIAPGDTLFETMNSPEPALFDWDDLFAEWLPVVHLDIARIDSGLSDLARAPYLKALSRVGEWVAASGQGALFNGRLADLLTDVPDRMSDFLERMNCRGRSDWFVYENYDARYSDFMLWGREALLSSNDDAFRKKWISEGLDFDFPFSEHRLIFAFEGAKRKKAVKVHV